MMSRNREEKLSLQSEHLEIHVDDHGAPSSADALNIAAREGNIQALHDLLRNDPTILDRVDEAPFAETPLHIAARHGMAELIEEIAILKPSFTRKLNFSSRKEEIRELNPDGLTPMHEALYSQQWKTVRVLMMLDSELIRVKGTGSRTPLHVAAEVAPKQLLAEFLFVCPSSILDVTSRWETAVHLAIRKGNLESFEVLFGWLVRVNKTQILSWKDINGDNALHFAAKAGCKEVVTRLIKYVWRDEQNFDGKTALDIHAELQGTQLWDEETRRMLGSDRSIKDIIRMTVAFSHRSVSLGRYYSSHRVLTIDMLLRCMGFRLIDVPCDKKSEKSRDVVLLVAVLIATAAYAAILTPPGGYWQDDSSRSSSTLAAAISNANANATTGFGKKHYAGQPIVHGPILVGFIGFNSLAFCFSLAAMATNIVELKQKFTLSLAMFVLLLTYAITLSINLSNWWSGFQPQTQPIQVIPYIAVVTGTIFIAIGILLSQSNFYGLLMDSQHRDIHYLVGCNRSISRYFGFSKVFGRKTKN